MHQPNFVRQEQTSRRGGQGSGTKWALRALIILAVIALLVPVASFVYPWLVAYGLLG